MTLDELAQIGRPKTSVPVPLPAESGRVESADAGAGPVCIVGLGYVGLPTAIAFADSGRRVIGCDLSEGRLADIKAAQVDLPDGDKVRLASHLGSKTFILTIDPAAVSAAEVVVVCVPTPIDSHLIPDLNPLRAACDAVVRYAVPGQTILLTSTSYVGCTRDLIAEPLRQRGFEIGRDVFVAFSPERIDPGNIGYPQQLVPRVVGGVTPACQERAVEALRRISCVVHAVTSAETAEGTKLLENTFRAVNIAFVNEFADACRELKLDVLEVIQAAATKPFGFMPFYPGPGVGGHCVPCDPHYLMWQLRARRTRLPVTESAMNAIATRPRQVAARVREILGAGRGLGGASILMVGVTYKPAVQDVRESPALEILAELARDGADVAYTDPLVPLVELDDRQLASVAEPAESAWDLVIVHTIHPGVDYSWLVQFPGLLDATYRASHLPDRAFI